VVRGLLSRPFGLCFLFIVFLCSYAYGRGRAVPEVLRIIHSNDRHGYIQGRIDKVTGRSIGGIDCEARVIYQLRREALYNRWYCLAVDAGDMFQGTPVVNESKGACMIELVGKLHYHIVTFGNHEFDYGVDILRKRVLESRFPWISANVTSRTLAGTYLPYATYKAGSVKLAFIGVTTTATPDKQTPERLGDVGFLEPKDVLSPLVARLRREHDVDVFVLLSHLGLDDDIELARCLPVFDVIVGGHSHSVLERPLREGPTWIVQTGAKARYVGVLDLHFDDDARVKSVEGRLVELDRQRFGLDPALTERIKEIAGVTEERLKRVIGQCPMDIPKEFPGVNSPMAVVVATAYREAAGCELGLMNFGGVRNGLDAGPVSLKDVNMVAPFANYVVRVELTGQCLRDILAHGVAGEWRPIPQHKLPGLIARGRHDNGGLTPIPARRTGYLCGAGIRYGVDPAKPEGERLTWVEVLGEPLDLNKLYTVATNDFLAAGGDDFPMFKRANRIVQTGILDADSITAYVQKHSPIQVPRDLAVSNATFKGAQPPAAW